MKYVNTHLFFDEVDQSFQGGIWVEVGFMTAGENPNLQLLFIREVACWWIHGYVWLEHAHI